MDKVKKKINFFPFFVKISNEDDNLPLYALLFHKFVFFTKEPFVFVFNLTF
ncbi:uncharacterized protein METZ01_LOCUS499613, partial [marine metagenome]